MARLSIVILLSVLWPGCIVTPSTVPATTASFSGNVANGGIIDLGPGSKGPAHVTQSWVDTYAALCAKYGKDLVPPVHAGDGVQALADNTYLVDFEHLADKNIMATLERSGLLP